MALYCWGNTAHGELGLGGIEEELITSPRRLDWSGSADIDDIACGLMHSLLLTGNGQVFACGNNDHGQLGQDLTRKRPQLICQLENYTIQQVCCGAAHSVALNEWGQCFTWGSNSRGQLGKDVSAETMCAVPKLVKQLATKHVVQVASGLYHTLALTNGGELYAWGSNSYGQLGLGTYAGPQWQPTLVEALRGIPIAFIACGGNHSFAISRSGAVFGWGKNLFGQLGINTEANRPYPAQLKTLRTLGVRYIAAGDDFTVFLTADGGVLTCGSGTYGQLGHGSMHNDMLPRAVFELMGTTCTQIACGGRHTLVFVPSRGRIYGFGLGGSGQLGTNTASNASLPQVVLGPWLSPSGQCLVKNPSDMVVRRIFSGGDHSFMSAVTMDDSLTPVDSRFWKPQSQILQLDTELATTSASFGVDGHVDQDILTQLETIFKSLACLNGSFHPQKVDNRSCNPLNPKFNMVEAMAAFESIARIEHETIKHIIWDGLTGLLGELTENPPDSEAMRIYLMLPLYHEFANPKRYYELHSRFAFAVLHLQLVPSQVLENWWAAQSVEYFERLIDCYKSVFSYMIQFVLRSPTDVGPSDVRHDPNLDIALRMLLYLFRLNRRRRQGALQIPCNRFHYPGLEDHLKMRQDYLLWLMERSPHQFSLCDYPFLFDARMKTLLLQTDQLIQMDSAVRNDCLNSPFALFGGGGAFISHQPAYIVFRVRRESIVEDTLREIQRFGMGDLKKPLRVIFDGEEAEDAGGVRKEFFLLLLRDLLDPKYGMFTEYAETRAIWFAEQTFEDNMMFQLIGALCGLAIYNFTIIHLPFPLVLYKKLLGDVTGVADLHDLEPTLARSLQSMLDYEGDDFEEVFGVHFELTREVFGVARRVELKPGGEKIAVTQNNKAEYVDLYVQYILGTSVRNQFDGFRDGFMRVCGGKVMELFEPHELMAVVIGNEDYDWDVLEENAEYKHGYTSGDRTIRMFWEVFHELPLAEKKKFLLFLTGSDRIPIQGMKAIKLLFQPTNNEKFLPVAHTCFNLLDLPRYQTKERLKFKLCQAIQQTLGFSLV